MEVLHTSILRFPHTQHFIFGVRGDESETDESPTVAIWSKYSRVLKIREDSHCDVCYHCGRSEPKVTVCGTK
jgi:hypothetical protein